MTSFKKDQHQLICDSLRAYIKHLESIEYSDISYLDNLRSFLGKLLREFDWSYILCPSPKKDLVGRLKVINSSSSEFPRKSKWKLYKNGILKKDSFFSSKKINLMKITLQIQCKSDFLYCLQLNDNEFIDAEFESQAISTIKDLSSILSSPTYCKRTLPSLMILDATAFYIENQRGNSELISKLVKILDLITPESYNLDPRFIKYSSPKLKFQPAESGKVKLEIGKESLHFLEEVLNEYSTLISSVSSADQDMIKIEKAKRLAEIFKKANS